jgi:hypothetical protein
MFWHKKNCPHRLHKEVFTHRNFYTQKFYPEQFLHTDFFPHTQAFTHRIFMHSSFYTDVFTHRPLHIFFSHTEVCAQSTFLHNQFLQGQVCFPFLITYLSRSPSQVQSQFLLNELTRYVWWNPDCSGFCSFFLLKSPCFMVKPPLFTVNDVPHDGRPRSLSRQPTLDSLGSLPRELPMMVVPGASRWCFRGSSGKSDLGVKDGAPGRWLNWFISPITRVYGGYSYS